MGLDQYAMAVMPHKENTDFSIYWNRRDIEAPDGAVTELAYWRKHSDLQGWMEDLWIAKRELAGNPAQPEEEGWFAGEIVFNCQPLRLTFQDLAYLEQAVIGDDLPHTTGFFFGASMPEDKDDTLAFIEKARQAIGCDMEVYYDSWW
jgi:hypothetical protein